MKNLRTLDDLDTKNKTVILRADFNVPVKDGKIMEDFRIEAVLPTIRELIKNHSRVIILSHMGRPKGVDKTLTLKPVAARLGELLKTIVPLVELDEALSGVPGKAGVILVENIRFFVGEEKNDPKFAQKLAGLGEVFVNDAFGTAHRAHASTVGLSKLLPSAAGRLMEKEITDLAQVLDKPHKPLVCAIAGLKVSTKIGLLKNLVKQSDIIIIGGAMANTFLVSQGFEVGRSIYEEEFVDEAEDILREAADSGCEVILPTDAVVSKSITGGKGRYIDDLIQVADDEYIVDIGKLTLQTMKQPIETAGTIVWNGPFGITEVPAFAKGTEEFARLTVQSKAKSIVGGGDTLVTVFKLHLEDKFDLVSTGGGAMLDFLEGKEMPALEALRV